MCARRPSGVKVSFQEGKKVTEENDTGREEGGKEVISKLPFFCLALQDSPKKSIEKFEKVRFCKKKVEVDFPTGFLAPGAFLRIFRTPQSASYLTLGHGLGAPKAQRAF